MPNGNPFISPAGRAAARSLAEEVRYAYRPNALRMDFGRTGGMQEKSPKAGQISASIHGLTHGEKLGELSRQLIFFGTEERAFPHVDPSTLFLADPLLTDRLLGLVNKNELHPRAIFKVLIDHLSQRNRNIEQIVNGLVVDQWQIPEDAQNRVTNYMLVIAQELAVGMGITRVKDLVAPNPRDFRGNRQLAATEIDSLSQTWGLDRRASKSLEKISDELIENLNRGSFVVRTSHRGDRYLRLAEPRQLTELPVKYQVRIRRCLKKLDDLNTQARAIAIQFVNFVLTAGEPNERLSFKEAVNRLAGLNDVNSPKMQKYLEIIFLSLFEYHDNNLHGKEAELLEFLYRRMVVPQGRSSEEIAEHMIITRKIPWLVEPGELTANNHMRALLRINAGLIEEGSPITYAAAAERSAELEQISGIVAAENMDRDQKPVASPLEEYAPPLGMLSARYMTLFDVDYRVRKGYLDKFRYYYYGHPSYYYMGMQQSGRNTRFSNLALAAQDGMEAYWGYTLKFDSLPEINAVLPWGAGMAHDLRALVEDSEWISTLDYRPTHRTPWQWYQQVIVDKINTESKNRIAQFFINKLAKNLIKAVCFLNPVIALAQLVDVFGLYPQRNKFHENAVHHLGWIRWREKIDYSKPLWYQPISSETRSESEDMGTAPHHLRLIKMASRYGGLTGRLNKWPLRRSAFLDGKAGHGSNYDDYRVLFVTARARWSRGNQSIRHWVLKTAMAVLTRLRFRQRIDYWAMQFKRVFFLTMPPAFVFLGLTPVIAGSWSFFIPVVAAAYVLGMGTYFWEMRAQGKTIRSCLRTIVQDYYGMLQGLKTTILGRYLNQRAVFAISPKKTYTIFKTPAKHLWFEYAILGINLSACAIATALGILSLGMPLAWLMFTTAFWALQNAAFIGAGLVYLNKGTKEENPKWIKKYEARLK